MSTYKPLEAYSYLVKIIYIKNIKNICMPYKLIGIHITIINNVTDKLKCIHLKNAFFGVYI